MDETDSSESDCMIVELAAPSAHVVKHCTENASKYMPLPCVQLHVDSSIIGIVPIYLPTPASLILAYENRTLHVSLVSSVINLHEQQRITVGSIRVTFASVLGPRH